SILDGGIVGVALFAIAFSQTENGSGGELAVLVELNDQSLIGLDGGVEVMIGFFFEEALLKGEAEVIGGSQGEKGEQKGYERDSTKEVGDGAVGERIPHPGPLPFRRGEGESPAVLLRGEILGEGGEAWRRFLGRIGHGDPAE